MNTITTAEELLEGDTYREKDQKIFRKIKSIHELPNSYYQAPVGHKIMIVTESSKDSILKETAVEILESDKK